MTMLQMKIMNDLQIEMNLGNWKGVEAILRMCARAGYDKAFLRKLDKIAGGDE